MNRTVIVAAGGDPFIINLWLTLFDRWKNEVSSCYICYNSDNLTSDEIEYLERIKPTNVNFIFVDKKLGFTKPLNLGLDASNEEYILFCDNDGFIYKPGIVDHYFQHLEVGVFLVGSPRTFASQNLLEFFKQKYETDEMGMWSNFCFVRRSDLLKTDLSFGGRNWATGDKIEPIDYVCTEPTSVDTFGWLMMQLRTDPKFDFYSVPQWHASPHEIEDYKNKANNWTMPDFGWIHAGSLHTGVEHYFRDDYPSLDGTAGEAELETRIAFWKIGHFVYSKQPQDTGYMNDELINQANSVSEVVSKYGLSQGRINRKMEIYSKLMKL